MHFQYVLHKDLLPYHSQIVLHSAAPVANYTATLQSSNIITKRLSKIPLSRHSSTHSSTIQHCPKHYTVSRTVCLQISLHCLFTICTCINTHSYPVDTMMLVHDYIVARILPEQSICTCVPNEHITLTVSATWKTLSGTFTQTITEDTNVAISLQLSQLAFGSDIDATITTLHQNVSSRVTDLATKLQQCTFPDVFISEPEITASCTEIPLFVYDTRSSTHYTIPRYNMLALTHSQHNITQPDVRAAVMLVCCYIRYREIADSWSELNLPF